MGNLDLKFGGTAAIACKNTNRNFIGIEKNEEYFNVTIKRIKDDNN